MSPTAVALAVLLHALAALGIWWLAQDPPRTPAEEVIEVTLEQPKPPEPPPPKPAVQPPQPTPPLEGLRPPAPVVSDKPTQVPPSGEPHKDAALAPPPPPLQDSPPTPEAQPSPHAAAEPAKSPAPTPKGPAPPPGKTGDLPNSAPQAPAAREQHALATPPAARPQPPPPLPPQPFRPESRPSPLTTAPPRRPPAGKRSDDPSPSPFVNPADVYNRARVADNYLWQVARKLQGYRYEARVNARQGITVVRIVIARNGRLLHAEVARSSGYPEFDNGVLAGVRAGSPYAPLPPDIRGDSATFDLPLMSINRQ